jgi:catechol 2,3-dioxygenase-like lactoylglutathione lyase family enzyme
MLGGCMRMLFPDDTESMPIEFEDIIPTLPARDVRELAAWYERLGFEQVSLYGDDYAIVQRGGQEIHFFHHSELDPKLNDHGCYLRLTGVDDLFAEYSALGLDRITRLEDRAWGMREFAVVDPDGNLLRIGEILGERRSLRP